MTYKQELSDLDAEIIAELYLRHIAQQKGNRGFVDPEKLLTLLRNASAPTRDMRDMPLSSYLRMVRDDHRVVLADVARALEVPIHQLEILESNDALPWEVPENVVAAVVCLYGLHIHSLEVLARNSCNLGVYSRRIISRHDATASMSEWISKVVSELESRGAKELII